MSATWKLTLPDSILEQLRCSMCDEYLSQLPVYSYTNQEGVVCSRCPVLTDQNPIRNVSYETIAKFILFPCRYKSFGCLEHIVPAQMQAHEESCLYKQHFCPFMPLGLCPWQGSASDLFEHYETQHQVLALHNPSFEIDLVNKYADNYLLLHDEHLFVIQLKCDVKEAKLWCSVRYIGSQKMADQFMFQVELSKLGCCDKVALPKKQVESDAKITAADGTVVQIDTATVREQLGDPSSIICKVVILPNEEINKSVIDTNLATHNISSKIVELGNEDEDILRDLECPVCNEYMVPPIHQCITGHSICDTCRKQVSCCPTCRDQIQTTRNFILEKMTRHIKYGCKYRDYDCPFISNSDNIRNHEKDCVYGPHPCPLKEFSGCAWKGRLTDIMTHAKEAHEDNVLEVDVINVPFEKNQFSEEDDCYLIKAFDEVFKLVFQCADEKCVWNVQHVGAKCDAEKFMYELDIIDNSNSGQRLFIKRGCGELTAEDVDPYEQSSAIVLSEDLLRPLVSDCDLTYRCHILKK